MTLIFSTSKSLISRLICWFTKSPASHVMIGLEIHGIPMLLHCTAGGVQVTPRTKWFRDSELVAEYTFRPDILEGLRYAFMQLGVKYDYVSLLGFIPVLLFRWLRVKIKNPLASAKSMVCSEFILHVDHAHKIPEWVGLDPETTSPQDLLVVCRKEQSFAKLVDRP